MAFKLENTPQNKATDKTQSSIENLLKKEITFFGEGFGNKKKQLLYQELAVLLKAGITIKEALTLIIESLKKNNDKELIQSILNEVVNGKPLTSFIRVKIIFRI
jgi:type II secretory pathway component PulF